MVEPTYNLYPETEPYEKNDLNIGLLHQVYYEQCGNPAGAPVIFLHGGPGSGCNPAQRRFFDPTHYRILLIDQRGCGRSKPEGEIRENTTQDLIADLEILREHLNIDRWHVFGGSWGSTLALAYAAQHTAQVISLTLRGVFLSRASELSWFLGEVRHFFPEVWQKLIDYLPLAERDNVLIAYEKRVFSEDPAIHFPAASSWNAFESNIMRLKPSEKTNSSTPKTAEELRQDQLSEVARARVQIHYIRHCCFIDGESLLKAAKTLNHIPTIIVQGRYDMVCPPQTAWELSQAMPNAKLIMVSDAGHSAMEPGITSALVAATEEFKAL